MTDPLTGTPDELTNAQKIEKILGDVGVDAEVTEDIKNPVEKQYVIDMGTVDMHAVGAAIDVHINKTGLSNEGSEFFTQGTLTQEGPNGDTLQSQRLFLPEWRMQDLEAMAENPETMQSLKQDVQMQVDCIPDGDMILPREEVLYPQGRSPTIDKPNF